MAVRRMLGGERTSLTGDKMQTESTSEVFFYTFITSMSFTVKDFSMCLLAWKLSENLHPGYGIHLVSSF